MRIDPDCMRDVLLSIEDVTDCENIFEYPCEDERLKKYAKNEVDYHLLQCKLSGFLVGHTQYQGGNHIVRYLSPSGHEFLENIRHDRNWAKVKDISKKVGSSSIKVLVEIATSVISEFMKTQL